MNAIAPGPILRPDEYAESEWQAILDASPIKYPISDDGAVSQFSKLILYFSEITMASGYIYPLDQGHNL